MAIEASISTPNVLKARDPALVDALTRFRTRLGEQVLNMIGDSTVSSGTRWRFPIPLDELRAVASVLFVLIKDSWTEQDLKKFDASWSDAIRSDLFGDEFESSRFRIQQAVEAAREKLRESPAIDQRGLW